MMPGWCASPRAATTRSRRDGASDVQQQPRPARAPVHASTASLPRPRTPPRPGIGLSLEQPGSAGGARSARRRLRPLSPSSYRALPVASGPAAPGCGRRRTECRAGVRSRWSRRPKQAPGRIEPVTRRAARPALGCYAAPPPPGLSRRRADPPVVTDLEDQILSRRWEAITMRPAPQAEPRRGGWHSPARAAISGWAPPHRGYRVPDPR